MSWIIAGLGNPGKEYVGSRHNVGRDVAAALEEKLGKKANVILPDVYMNASGSALKNVSPKKLVVLHDDLDVPLGSVKISFVSGAGGHKGVESVIKWLKTKDFIRVRIGISPATPRGKLRRPEAKKLADFVLGKFRPPEKEKLKKVKKLVGEALELILTKGIERAQTKINSQ